MRVLLKTLWIGLLAAVCAGHGFSSEGEVFFETEVRAILMERCYPCHSEASGKQKGNLLLDRKAGWERGGDAGAVILPGKLESSRLIHAIRYTDEDLQMPPKSRLPKEEVKILEQWVEMGAPDPRDAALAGAVRKGRIDFAAARAGWAYRPLQAAGKSIDGHIEAGLAEANLRPVPLAGARERVRRLFYDLTGLPPTPVAVKNFAANPSSEAWARLVDEALARPGFGETWGRHWLDVVRYADSNGGDRNFTYYQAWRFRNYVIDAFNQDRSYYTLVREQVAGDVLPWETDAQRAQQLIGSTFLALGPKMLTERDKEKLWFDVVDEQLDTLGRSFLGLTLGCARCHDHKFDPISQEDYYAMAGILRSTEVVSGTRNGCVNVASWVEQPLPDASEQVKQEREQLELAMRLVVEKNFREKNGGKPTPMNLPFAGVIVDDEDAELVGDWKKSTLFPQHAGSGYVHDQKLGKGEKKAIFRAGLPESGEYEVRVSYNAGSERAAAVPVAILAQGGVHKVVLNQQEPPAVGNLFQPIGRFRFEKGTPSTVTISTTGSEGYVIVDAVQWIAVSDLEREAVAMAQSDTNAMSRLLGMNEKELKKELERIVEAHKTADLVMAPRDVTVPADVHLRVRGVTSQRGALVPRGFLEVLTPEGGPKISEDESGRVPLAKWLTRDENALLDRVMVNRIWYHMMGQGLVRTVDNFGVLGDTPSHPELLDDLAARFRESDGSVKQLVREIALSEAYQRSSERPETFAEADPENRLCGHQNRRRLAAEELRDSVFLIAGELDRAVAKGTSHVYGQDLDKPMQWMKHTQRAVYLPVARNNPSGELTIFDRANPDMVGGVRPVTTVPTQALFMMNGELIARQAGKVVARVRVAVPEVVEGQVRWLYQEVYQRAPREDEQARAMVFLDEMSAETGSVETAMKHFVSVLFASTEFQFLD